MTARLTDPETSRTAGLMANLPRGQARVLSVLSAHDGLTDYEISTLTGLLRGSAAKRRGELVTAGVVVDSGDRRKTDTGRPAVVWTVA